MKIGMRRWSVMMAAILGIVAVEILSIFYGHPGLSVSGAGAIIGLVAGYVGFDSLAKQRAALAEK